MNSIVIIIFIIAIFWLYFSSYSEPFGALYHKNPLLTGFYYPYRYINNNSGYLPFDKKGKYIHPHMTWGQTPLELKGVSRDWFTFQYKSPVYAPTMDLRTDLIHDSFRGKFLERYKIGNVGKRSIRHCKNICNKIDNCKGISYHKNDKTCHLYNNTTRLQPDTNFVSWRNFYNKLY